MKVFLFSVTASLVANIIYNLIKVTAIENISRELSVVKYNQWLY